VEDWKIKLDRARCTKPECPLPIASEYFALLKLPECIRRDLCAECFQAETAANDREPIFWKARRRRGQREPVLDLESLRVLFHRLGEETDERARGLRYFVSLLLLRKRALKLVDAKSAEQEQADLVVVDPRIPDMAPVALSGPELSDEKLAALREELQEAIGE
jgi:hypothetical protein